MRASFVAQAMCGVTIQFFACSKGLSSDGGSLESTSTAAPARYPSLSASARSCSITSGPREELMRNEPGFILDNDEALIIPRVCGNSGQCKLTTSAVDISSSTSHQRKPGH